MASKIKSIATGSIVKYGECGNIFESAYKKDQFFNYVNINEEGIETDQHADKKHHGGKDKAIHIGSSKHFDMFSQMHKKELDKLAIGCNIVVDGIDESEVCVGDIYSMGDILVEVTQPRQPCWKIGALFGKEVSRYITKNSATGWYVRVLKEGVIYTSDTMKLEKRVSDLSIKELSLYLHKAPAKKELIEQILSVESLADSYKKDLKKSIDRS
jgi:MOSC domain-containing protein YiiM